MQFTIYFYCMHKTTNMYTRMTCLVKEIKFWCNMLSWKIYNNFHHRDWRHQNKRNRWIREEKVWIFHGNLTFITYFSRDFRSFLQSSSLSPTASIYSYLTHSIFFVSSKDSLFFFHQPCHSIKASSSSSTTEKEKCFFLFR